MKNGIWVLFLALAGCGTSGAQFRSDEYQNRPTLDRGLMQVEEAVLSQESIDRLLTSRIQLPDRIKVAVYSFGHRSHHFEEAWGRGHARAIGFLQERKAIVDAFEKPLLTTGRFVEVTHVPSNLLTGRPSLQRIREAAALMQAHLLLVIETASELVTYHGNIFTKDEVEATAVIELFVLDVRTGAIPYADTHDATMSVKEIGEDWTIEQVQRRAERLATLKAVAAAADGLGAFFKP